MLGGGAALVLFGVSLYSPRLVRPLAAVIGAPLERLRGLTGRLARENSQRNPSRTAATAAALMIGLALVSFVTIFAAGLKASIADAIDNSFQGELEIQNTNGFDPIPTAAAEAVRKVPGVQTVSTLQATQVKIDGVSGKPRATGLDPATANQVLKLDFQGDTHRADTQEFDRLGDDRRQVVRRLEQPGGGRHDPRAGTDRQPGGLPDRRRGQGQRRSAGQHGRHPRGDGAGTSRSRRTPSASSSSPRERTPPRSRTGSTPSSRSSSRLPRC